MAFLLLLISMLLGNPQSAYAQNAPQRVATTTSSGTVVATGTFIQLLPSASRNSCTVQYEGSGTGYVYFGLIGSATTPTSFQLVNKQSINCNIYGLALTDAVNGTGNTGDIFVVTTQ